MPHVYVESFGEFAERHGHDQVAYRGTLFLFSDGAICNQEGSAFQEPPEKPSARLHLQRDYARIRVERAEGEFSNASTAFAEQATLAARYRNLPPPPSNAPEILESLKAEVYKWRERLAELEEQLSKTPEANEAQRRQRLESDRKSRMNELSARIRSIKL